MYPVIPWSAQRQTVPLNPSTTMYFRRFCLLFAPILSTVVADLLGPTYPAPTDLSSSDSHVKKAWSLLSTAFDESLKKNNTTPGFKDLVRAGKVTFSTSLFSLRDPAAIDLQYHYTAPQVTSAQYGTNEVNGDSIYRVASISKLITVFTGMLELTDAQWNTPLSEVFPGLASLNKKTGDPLEEIQWDSITPWTLANQLSGIPTLGLPQADALAAYNIQAATLNVSAESLEAQEGFPPLPLSIFGSCISLEFNCSRSSFIDTIASDVPVQLPWATPGYSDLNFMLLGAAISKITGKPFDKMYPDFVFEPLDMASTYVNAPLSGSAFDDHAVVVGPIEGSWNFAENNPTLPSGGILSTINDLNKFGTGVLNSTLLDTVKTREWMKPHTHTASLTTSIGAPWEIVRYLNPNTGKVTDIYTKLGDSGAYGGMVALIPDYDAGFTFLNAYYEAVPTLYRGETALTLINHIAEAIIPALEAQAAAEAMTNFVGTYVSEDNTINSSLTISFNNSDVPTALSGLSIESWISNGTDMLSVATTGLGGLRPALQPAISNREDGCAGQIAFRASVNSQYSTYLAGGYGPFTGFYDANWDVWTYEGTEYGGYAVRNVVFNVDAQGYAKSVRIRSTRATLKRKETEAKYIMRGIS